MIAFQFIIHLQAFNSFSNFIFCIQILKLPPFRTNSFMANTVLTPSSIDVPRNSRNLSDKNHRLITVRYSPATHTAWKNASNTAMQMWKTPSCDRIWPGWRTSRARQSPVAETTGLRPSSSCFLCFCVCVFCQFMLSHLLVPCLCTSYEYSLPLTFHNPDT